MHMMLYNVGGTILYTLNRIPHIFSVDFIIYSVAHSVHLNNVVEPCLKVDTCFFKINSHI